MRALPLAAALVIGTLAGCRQSGRPIGARPTREPQPAIAMTVEVTNANWQHAVVYAVLNGQAVRLGEVETGRTRTFGFPAGARGAGEVEILAQLIGSNAAYATGPIMLQPGTVIEVSLENNLALSSYSIRADAPSDP